MNPKKATFLTIYFFFVDDLSWLKTFPILQNIAHKVNVPLTSFDSTLEYHNNAVENDPMVLEGGDDIESMYHKDIKDKVSELVVDIPNNVLVLS